MQTWLKHIICLSMDVRASHQVNHTGRQIFQLLLNLGYCPCQFWFSSCSSSLLNTVFIWLLDRFSVIFKVIGPVEIILWTFNSKVPLCDPLTGQQDKISRVYCRILNIKHIVVTYLYLISRCSAEARWVKFSHDPRNHSTVTAGNQNQPTVTDYLRINELRIHGIYGCFTVFSCTLTRVNLL